MKLIVADTGPMNYLIQLGCEVLLPRLVTTLILPTPVLCELRAAGAPPNVRAWANELPQWVDVLTPVTLIPAEPELAEADRSAISLAKELHALLLMDDRRARRAAAVQRVKTIGTLGILELAAAKEWISLPVVLEQLRATTIFISNELMAQALRRDQQRRDGRL
jgi:predicted nucleic acid-binding protein